MSILVPVMKVRIDEDRERIWVKEEIGKNFAICTGEVGNKGHDEEDDEGYNNGDSRNDKGGDEADNGLDDEEIDKENVKGPTTGEWHDVFEL